MKHVNEQEHKIEGKNVLYFNGKRWLVREFCKTKKRANELIQEVVEYQKQLKEKKHG